MSAPRKNISSGFSADDDRHHPRGGGAASSRLQARRSTATESLTGTDSDPPICARSSTKSEPSWMRRSPVSPNWETPHSPPTAMCERRRPGRG